MAAPVAESPSSRHLLTQRYGGLLDYLSDSDIRAIVSRFGDKELREFQRADWYPLDEAIREAMHRSPKWLAEQEEERRAEREKHAAERAKHIEQRAQEIVLEFVRDRVSLEGVDTESVTEWALAVATAIVDGAQKAARRSDDT